MSMDLMYRRHRGSSAEVRRDKNGSRGLTAQTDAIDPELSMGNRFFGE